MLESPDRSTDRGPRRDRKMARAKGLVIPDERAALRERYRWEVFVGDNPL